MNDCSTSTAALQGVRVVDMTSMGMGPLAAQILGDHGADVVKLEPPTGDVFRHNVPQSSHGMSHNFIQFNRNKRSVAIDLKSPEGFKAGVALFKTTDILISNLRPQALAELGLGYDFLRTLKPDIIFCGAYGYSEKGPYAGRPAADDAIQAVSGLAALQQMATASEQPEYVANVVADKVVALALVNAVMAALLHRFRTGRGQSIEVPMFETMVAFVMPEHVAGLSFVPPRGGPVYTRVVNPQRRPYETKDGYLCVMPYTTGQWQRFFRLIGRPDLAEDKLLQSPTERSARYLELYEVIRQAMPARTTEEWMEALLASDIIFGRVNSPSDLFEDPHLRALDMFPLVEHPTEGTLRLIGFPITLSETPNRMRLLPPRIGQHTREVLAELGYSEDELGRLEAAHAIVCDPAT